MSRVSIDYPQYSLPDSIYCDLKLHFNLSFETERHWDIYKADPNLLLEKLNTLEEFKLEYFAQNYRPDVHSVIYTLKTTYSGVPLCVAVDFSKTHIDINIASYIDRQKDIEKHFKFIEKIYPADAIQNDDVKVNFWYLSHGGGPSSVGRKIGVPTWDKIRNNYNPKVSEALSYLINDFKPSTGGQLIIFSGKPGTGKTYSLRAMLRAWKDWCIAEYILDPDILFGGNGAGYLAQLVLKNSADEYQEINDEDDIIEIPDSKKWRLLILEDGGELLTDDAKDRTGQGLSRLLNIVDGLIGQGLRILILITTNEDFENLHPAVVRDGRCVANVKFTPFQYTDAGVWATEHGIKIPATVKEYSLAELYNLVNEHSKDWGEEAPKKGLGFRVP